MKKTNSKNKYTQYSIPNTGYRRGFTLIEFLVVLSIVIFIIPSVFGLIYSLLRQQSRGVALQEIKRQGDLVFNHMKTTINNNAVSTYSDLAGTTPICASTGSSAAAASSMYFLNNTGVNSYFGYNLSGSALQYVQTGSAATLTNSAVNVSSLALSCTKVSEFAPPLVDLAFTVSQSANNVSLRYKTLIKLNTH